MNFIFVALGGAIGSCLRYAISLIPNKTDFPVLTLVTNILGALLIGYIVGISSRKGLNQNLTLMLKTGLCGGFTTFSTFSLEAYNLFVNGNMFSALIYIILSLVGCIFGVAIGMKLSCIV
jgi:CrcB protein